MTDMLVNLYNHPMESNATRLQAEGIAIKQSMALDKDAICDFVSLNFKDINPIWACECEIAILRQPSSCFVAVHNKEVVGFCCYDSTAKGMLGPLGVRLDFRKRGIATELMFQSFEAMKGFGYAYAVIGWVSSEDFYRQKCAAIPIPNSFPGVYKRLISQ